MTKELFEHLTSQPYVECSDGLRTYGCFDGWTASDTMSCIVRLDDKLFQTLKEEWEFLEDYCRIGDLCYIIYDTAGIKEIYTLGDVLNDMENYIDCLRKSALTYYKEEK